MASSLTTPIPVTGYSATGFPNYAQSADWSIQVPASTTTVATSTHVYTLENRTLTALNSVDGTVAATLPLTSSVDLAAATEYDGEDGLFWTRDATAYGWSPAQESTEAFSAAVPQGAVPYAAGAEVLFVSPPPDDEGTYAAWRFGPSGFSAVSVPTGFIPGALTGDSLVSTNSAGDIMITGSDGEEITAYPLQAPTTGVSFKRTVAVGYDTVVALWSPFPDSTSPSTPVVVATYVAGTGELKSHIEITSEQVDGAPDWLWGNDGAWASYAGFAFDVPSGRAVMDLEAQGIEATSVVGPGILGHGAQGNTYSTTSNVWSISGVVPLILDETAAVVRTSRSTVEKYPVR